MEVITGPERRRDWPDADKIANVAKVLEPGVTCSVSPASMTSTRSSFSGGAGGSALGPKL